MAKRKSDLYFFGFGNMAKAIYQRIDKEAFGEIYSDYGSSISEKVKSYHIENGGLSRYEKIRYFNEVLLKDVSNLTPLKLNNEDNIKKEIIKIKIVRKYLLISFKSKFILVKINLFIKTFLGLLKDKIWFKEYLNKE